MAQPSVSLPELQLMELPLLDRMFTWSNKRDTPTLARLDRVLLKTTMSTTFPNTTLTSLTRPTSDHTPLVVTISTTVPKPNIFRFENSWLIHNDFLPSILPAWCAAPGTTDAAGDLASSLKASRGATKGMVQGKAGTPFFHTKLQIHYRFFRLARRNSCSVRR